MHNTVEEIDQSILNQEQKFVVPIVEHQVSKYDSKPVLVMGGPGNGKSTVIKIIINTINSDNMVQLGTTITAYFFICSPTCHSKLYFPVNKPYLIFMESILTVFKTLL